MDIISERIDRRFNCSKILGETYEFSECISIDRDFNLSMYIHFETKYKDDFYFKVFNDVDFMKATKCCRIKIFKSMYKKQQIDGVFQIAKIESSFSNYSEECESKITVRYD